MSRGDWYLRRGPAFGPASGHTRKRTPPPPGMEALRHEVRMLLLRSETPLREVAALVGLSLPTLHAAQNAEAVTGRPSLETLQRIRAVLPGAEP
jgi:hypothetical protein